MFNKQEIYEALQCKHSPLLASSNPAMSKSKFTQAQIEQFKSRAEEYLSDGLPPILYSDFCKYFITGDRLDYQKPYYTIRGHLLVFSVLAKETGEQKYIDALNEAIWALCSEVTWSLPAHMFDQNGKEIPTEDFATNIDLFASETAFALAEALCLCQAHVPPMLMRLAKQSIDNRIFKPFEQADAMFRFELMSNNWSAVCAGAIGGAAMYLMTDETRLAGFLHRCLSAMSVYLNSFGDDGVCAEGVSYWNYGFGFFTAFAQLLQTRTNGVLNLFALPKVKAIAKAGTEFYLGKTSTISFSDGSEDGAYRNGLMCFLSKEYDFSIPPPIAAADTITDGCFRYCTGIRDFYWVDENPSYLIGGGGATWLADAQWLIVRDNECCMVAKAGHNAESHNHNDCGSFIFVKNGEQIICDLGAGLYDKAYFSDTRYEILVNRSASHNIAMINGTEQLAGAKYACQNVECITNKLVCELTDCYNVNTLKNYTRSISMANKEIEICDSFAFSENGSVCLVFCGKGPIEVQGNTATFTRNGESAQLVFDNLHFDAKVEAKEYPAHEKLLDTAYFLYLTNKNPAKEIEFKASIK